MGLLDKLKTGILGLRGAKPQQFGVNPVPPDSLHLNYSTDGKQVGSSLVQGSYKVA